MWIPVHRSWRLNERHYGALQGLNKAETAAQYGEQQVKIWRRSYDVPPPALDPVGPRFPGPTAATRTSTDRELPRTESSERHGRPLPALLARDNRPGSQGRQARAIAAHGNSLRALVKHLDGVSDDDIVAMNIPTGVPLVYELDADLRPIRHEYLGDVEQIRKAQEAVARQGQAFQAKVLAALSDSPQTAEQVAAAAGVPDAVESVFLILEHLAANGCARIADAGRSGGTTFRNGGNAGR